MGIHHYDDYPARECSPRDGIPNTIAGLAAGRPVRIAYFGGSITAQKGWRIASRLWLQQQYPAAAISEINAALGGTGSDLGAFRLYRDVLRHTPDLVFVEFAVNDSGQPSDRILKSMEGIVRQIWRHLPLCDICFAYTLTHGHTAVLQQGRCTTSQGVMETLADHYGIASVNMGLEVARLEQAGKVIMKSPDKHVEQVAGESLDVSSGAAHDEGGVIPFSNDGVHPYTDTGHQLYLAAFMRAFEKLKPVGTTGGHLLPVPLHEQNWEAAQLVELSRATLSGAEKLRSATSPVCAQFEHMVPELWRLPAGGRLCFQFAGTAVALYDLLGPDGGMVQIALDGQTTRQARFDPYCTWTRLAPLWIGEQLPDGPHTVTVEVRPDHFDKRSILFEENRQDFDEHPEKYADFAWHAAAILVVGELV